MQKETMRPAGRIITYMPFVSWSIVVVFSRTTCSVDATLIKRPVGLPRFPNYDPAPRHAPRGMRILYQIFARGNGCNVNLIWPHIVPSRDSPAPKASGWPTSEARSFAKQSRKSPSDGTPCLAIRSLQDLPTGGGGVAPRRTFTILARNQTIGSMRE